MISFRMKLLILFCLITSEYYSECYGQDVYQKEERGIGGDYGGLTGLTTYHAGLFLVNGKYETDNYGKYEPDIQRYGLKESQRDSKKDRDSNRDNKDDYSKNNEEIYNSKYIGNEEYEDLLEYDGGEKNNENVGYSEHRGKDERYCIGEYRNRDRQRYGYNDGSRRNRERSDSYYDDDIKERCDRLFGFTGPTANDEPENLMRPCALDDWQCVRKYFAANSKCKPTYGPIPDPLYIDVNTAFYPASNISIAFPNLVVRGLSSAKIREFYVNKKTGNLVFALHVVNMNKTVPRAYARYRRSGKESIVLADIATINYPAVTFTAVIPKVPHLRLDLADIHVFIEDPSTPLVIGPGAFESKDPDVVSEFARFLSQLPTNQAEGQFFQAPLFTSIYIQENICDFGLKLISV